MIKPIHALIIIAWCFVLMMWSIDIGRADPVMWSKQQYWNVVTTTDRDICAAGAIYSLNGFEQEIIIGLRAGVGWEFGFRNTRVTQMVKGEGYDLTVMFGPSTIPVTVHGTALDVNQILVDTLPKGFVDQLAAAKTITFEKMGTYPLDGSKRAIETLLECFEQVILNEEPKGTPL